MPKNRLTSGGVVADVPKPRVRARSGDASRAPEKEAASTTGPPSAHWGSSVRFYSNLCSNPTPTETAPLLAVLLQKSVKPDRDPPDPEIVDFWGPLDGVGNRLGGPSGCPENESSERLSWAVFCPAPGTETKQKVCCASTARPYVLKARSNTSNKKCAAQAHHRRPQTQQLDMLGKLRSSSEIAHRRVDMCVSTSRKECGCNCNSKLN